MTTPDHAEPSQEVPPVQQQLPKENPSKVIKLKDKFKAAQVNALGHLSLDARLAVREARHNTAQYCIGCTAVFIVVALVSILMTILIYSPVVFLTLAENKSGELDLVLSTPNYDMTKRLNYTAVRENLGMSAHLSVPRMSGVSVTLFVAPSCAGFASDTFQSDNSYTYTGLSGPDAASNASRSACSVQSGTGCLSVLCSQGAPGQMQVIQTNNEQALGIGRGWSYPPVPPGTIYLHNTLARTLDVGVGDRLYVSFNWQQAFPVTWSRLSPEAPSTSQPTSQVNIPVIVNQILADNGGKLELTDNAVFFMEWDQLLATVAQSLPPQYNQTFIKDMQDPISIKEMDQEATNVIMACSDHRIECYMDPQYKTVSKFIVDWASDNAYQIGFTEVETQLPVLAALSSTQYFSAFLNLIFSMVVILLCALSCFLICSLLMVSVETKTFELGIFRMIGMSKWGVMSLLAIQALSYSLPAWVIGLVTAQGLWVYLRKLLAASMGIDVGVMLAANAVVLATALGVLVPLLASIIPIRRALHGNLHDALDTRRAASKAVIVTIERTHGGQLSSGLLIVGTLLTVFGFCVYYFLPMALVTTNIALLFNIFLVLLIGMMVGLVMLSLNLEPLLERGLVKLCFLILWFENRSMGLLVVKNLVSHRMRNRKTTIMYALSLGFIIFLTVSIRIELSSLVFTGKRVFASDLQIVGASYQQPNGAPVGIDLEALTTYERYLAANPYVESWSYTSFALKAINTSATTAFIENLGGTTQYLADVRASGPGFLGDTDPAFTVFSDYDSSLPSGMPVSEHLYTVKGSYSSIIGTLYSSTLDLTSFAQKFLHSISYTAGQSTSTVDTLLAPLHFASSLPNFVVSEFLSATTAQDMVISMPQFLEFASRGSPGGGIQSIVDVPVSNIFVFLKPSVSAQQTQAIIYDLTKLSTYETISSVADSISGISSASSSLGWIFQAITVMAMLIAFFSLNSSMYTNIMEQKKEMGVLRSLGLKRAAIFRLFSYEAFVLIFSAALLGTMIGVSVGWTMATQRSIVTQVPLQFAFPWDIFGLVFGVSVVCSVLSTVGPIYQLIGRRNIVSLLK